MIKLLTIISLSAFLSCADNHVSPNPSSMQTVYYNGKIYTMNAQQPWASAMIVEDGVIHFVGDDTEALEQAAASSHRVDLHSALVLPGLHDVHMHPLEAASDNFQFNVDESVTDPEDHVLDVSAAHHAHPGDGWLLGWGYDLEVLLDAERLPYEILDDISVDRPIAIMEQTSHSIWCNSRALALMEINDQSSDPAGGVIMREEDGTANGILVDNAGNMLIDLALPVTAESRQNDYQGLIDYALPELAKHGITSICDARTYWKRQHHLTWKRVAEENKLTVRVNLGLWAYPTESDAKQLSTLKSLYDFNPESLLRINQIKLYADGIIHNTTAAMRDDYKEDYYGLETNNGLNYFNEARIAYYIQELGPIGFDFHIHAIGNRGIHEALNAIEQSGASSQRHRLTHVEYVNPSDISRFAALNVTADAQVAGDFTQPHHWHDFDYLIDASVSENMIPIKSLVQEGARVTLSSDWDVSTLNPFVGIQNAITRSPQNISLHQALQAYTLNAAYVMRQEAQVGSLEPGKEADFIVLDRDIFEIDPEEINQTQITETYLRGVLIYKR